MFQKGTHRSLFRPSHFSPLPPPKCKMPPLHHRIDNASAELYDVRSHNTFYPMLFPTKNSTPRRLQSTSHLVDKINRIMCKPATHKPKMLPAFMLSSFITPPIMSSFFQGPYSKRKIVLLVFLASILLGTITFTTLYTFHRGFRRTIQFWRGMAPLIAKYKYVNFKAQVSLGG